MKRLHNLALSSAIVFILAGCGGGGGSSESPNEVNSEARQITTQQDAQNSIVVLQNYFLFGNIYQNSNPTLSSRTVSRTHKRLYEQERCPYGGMVSYRGSESGNGTFAFDNCFAQKDFLMNGKINSSNIVFDQRDDMSSGVFDYVNLSMKTDDILVTASGLNAKFNINSNMRKISIKYNGNTSISQGAQKYSFTMYDYAVVGSRSTTEANGKIKTDVCGVSRLYDIKTVQPFRVSSSGSYILSGQLNVNGANYTFNRDGTIKIDVNGTSSAVKQTEAKLHCSN